MKIQNKKPVIYIISGKAVSGKDTVAKLIDRYHLNQKGTILAYASYIKDYAKVITDWDGNEETKPRTFLQELGTEVIRNHIDNRFFIRRMIEDIQVYSYFLDYIIIADARTKEEIEEIKNKYDRVVTLHIKRPNYNNGLTLEQSRHSTELELDHYSNFDYEIVNDSKIEDLEKKVIEVLEEIKYEFER